jgi:hypothetical protein
MEFGKEHVELWLFKVPKDFDVKKLDQVSLQIPLDQKKRSKVKVGEKAYSVVLGEETEYHHFINAFPTDEEYQLRLGK